MSNIYVEHNPKTGHYEAKLAGNSTPIATGPTQGAVLDKVNIAYPHLKPDVERIRHTKKGGPDQWRSE